MKSARFLTAAREEFLAQVVLYSKESPHLGERFRLEVESAAALALSFPTAGSPYTNSTRRVFLKNFPFSVVYRESEAELLVVAVAHFSRMPGYWSNRVQSR